MLEHSIVGEEDALWDTRGPAAVDDASVVHRTHREPVLVRGGRGRCAACLVPLGTIVVGAEVGDGALCAYGDQQFLEGVAAKLAPHPIKAEHATRDVFALLAQAIDSGEIADVINQLPAGIKELWPTGMNRWAESRAHR